MKADLIIHHARIYTADSARPWAEAVACTGGRITAVGSNDDIREWAGSKTQLINAKGRLVLPGLIDAHIHFLDYAIRRHQVNLFGIADFEAARRRVQQAVKDAGPDQWILGWGWDENPWGVHPTRRHLDEIAPNNPVVLSRMDMHTFWLNSAALNRAGLTRHTPDPPDSRLERDASGELTGILREWNALKLVQPHIPKPNPDTLQDWLAEAISQAHQFGLTGIHDQRVEQEGRRSFRLFQALRRQDRLNLRVHMNIAADYLAEAATLGLQPGFGDDRLWVGHIKVFADGTMGSRTARMLAPFENEPENTGLTVTPAKELSDLANRAVRAGFSLSVHAIGDRAVRDVIEVLSEFPVDLSPGSHRLPHRIEHVQVIHPDDLPRLSRHNLVASVQPVHICTDWSTADRVWGRRSRYAYAFRSLLEHGTRLALGSDAPVAPPNPLLGIYAAVTRQNQDGNPAGGWYPEERISLAEAVQGYTTGPAYVSGKQQWQGSISPGKWADIIMLNQNIFDIPPEAIPHTTVELTVFDGRIVHYPAGEIHSARKSILFSPIIGPEYR